MVKAFLIITLNISVVISSIAQNKESGLKHIQNLSAKKYAGRGYVKNGLNKAAKYIRKELKKDGVKAATEDYFQFTNSFPVNTFPGHIKLEGLGSSETMKKTVNKYSAGYDFLVNPKSGNISLSNQELIIIEEEIPLKEFKSNHAYYILKNKSKRDYITKVEDYFLGSENLSNSLLIIYDTTKLTWYPAMTKSRNGIIYIKKPVNEKTINAQWNSRLINDFQGINIVAKVKGKRSDSSVFFTAHYDHLGMLGKHMFPGANDNASGVAMLLDIAQFHSKNQPQYDTYFLFTCAEELGLLGSYFYLQNPVTPLSNIKLLINLDMVGTGEEGITIVNAKKNHRFYDLMQNNNEANLKAIKARGEACNSDHCLFDKAEVPAVFIYTLGGKRAYHDVHDNGEGLSLYAYEGLIKLIIEVVKDY